MPGPTKTLEEYHKENENTPEPKIKGRIYSDSEVNRSGSDFQGGKGSIWLGRAHDKDDYQKRLWSGNDGNHYETKEDMEAANTYFFRTGKKMSPTKEPGGIGGGGKFGGHGASGTWESYPSLSEAMTGEVPGKGAVTVTSGGESTIKNMRTWKDRVASGNASDSDMEEAYKAWKEGTYRPGRKTLLALEEMDAKKKATEKDEDGNSTSNNPNNIERNLRTSQLKTDDAEDLADTGIITTDDEPEFDPTDFGKEYAKSHPGLFGLLGNKNLSAAQKWQLGLEALAGIAGAGFLGAATKGANVGDWKPSWKEPQADFMKTLNDKVLGKQAEETGNIEGQYVWEKFKKEYPDAYHNILRNKAFRESPEALQNYLRSLGIMTKKEELSFLYQQAELEAARNETVDQATKRTKSVQMYQKDFGTAIASINSEIASLEQAKSKLTIENFSSLANITTSLAGMYRGLQTVNESLQKNQLASSTSTAGGEMKAGGNIYGIVELGGSASYSSSDTKSSGINQLSAEQRDKLGIQGIYEAITATNGMRNVTQSDVNKAKAGIQSAIDNLKSLRDQYEAYQNQFDEAATRAGDITATAQSQGKLARDINRLNHKSNNRTIKTPEGVEVDFDGESDERLKNIRSRLGYDGSGNYNRDCNYYLTKLGKRN